MTKGFLGAVLVLAFSGSANAEIVKLECISTYATGQYHLDTEKKTIKCHRAGNNECAAEYVGPHDLISDDENHYWQHGQAPNRTSYKLDRTTLRLLQEDEELGVTIQKSCRILGPPKL